jgi:tRNA (cytidine/uridine-2'-O-)-methyltransferase
MKYEPDSFLLFGKESTGIPGQILDRFPDTSVRIPMKEGVISMNLSDCVSIILFEALRQNGFEGLI